MIRHIAFGSLGCLLLCGFAGGAQASTAESPGSTIPQLLRQYSEHADFALPELTANETTNLAAGKPVVRILRGTPQDGELSAMGIIGLRIVDAPRLLVWLAVLGGTGEPHPRTTRAILARHPAGSHVGYQHADIPWPVRDRHWVIYTRKNLDLANASDGVIWEHYWNLHEHGRQLLSDTPPVHPELWRKLENAVYLPANRGAWALFDLGSNRTLVLGLADFELGGFVPSGLARSYTKRQLRRGLKQIDSLTARIHQKYTGDPIIHDGHGMPITPQQARDVAELWSARARQATTD